MVGFIASQIAAAAAMAGVLFPTTATANVTSYPSHRCALGAPAQTVLNLTSTTLDVGAYPWGVAYLNESIAFVANNLSLAVLDTTEFTPTLIAEIPYPSGLCMSNEDITQDGYQYREMTLTHDKRNLYIATGYGAVIFDVPMAIGGQNDSIVGVLSSDGYVGQSAIQLSITPNDEFIFVSQEFGSNLTENRGAVEVYNVTRLDNGTVISSWRGYIVLGYATIGQQFSSDYTKLFVTSELATLSPSNSTIGVVSVLDVEKLKFTPGKSLITRVFGGCRTNRCHLTPDGTQLWVTDGEANRLTVFDVDTILSNETENVVLATINTGTSPIGVAELGDYIMTTDSNRFNYVNVTTGITVVNSTAAMEGQVNFPQIPTSAFPRSLVVSPSGDRLLVSEWAAGTVRIIDVSSLNTK